MKASKKLLPSSVKSSAQGNIRPGSGVQLMMAAFSELRISRVLLGILIPAVAPGAAAVATTCETLRSLKMKDATVTAVQSVPAGSFKLPGVNGAFKTTAAFCRVALTLKPSADSNIRAEVWLPSGGWNSRFLGVGNGGFAGSIDYPELAEAVSKGYAAAATDTGHEADAGDARWALNHPEKIIDFGYRAIHETAGDAKAVIREFYGDAPKRSYFNSCSDGGREGLIEAQRFPGDYDGVVAGSPAGDWTHLMTQLIYNMQAIGTPESYIPSAKLRAIENNALSQCDALDGVKDGVIENPTACHVDLPPLLCKSADTNECLTQPQLDALAKIYAGPKTSSPSKSPVTLRVTAGRQVMPGLSPGGEAEPAGWSAWITGARPESGFQYAIGTSFFRYMVYNDPVWDYTTSTVDDNVKLARILNATDPNLKEFRTRGGKLILYHGWADAAIPPQNTVGYYESIVSRMGPKASGSFARLFMVPGMQHCASSGAGASTGVLNVTPRADADHDLAAAIERWVEEGIAPDRVIVSKPELSRTRLLCGWPKTAHYSGNGSTDEAANFTCQ
jgi:feruloyl esterase